MNGHNINNGCEQCNNITTFPSPNEEKSNTSQPMTCSELIQSILKQLPPIISYREGRMFHYYKSVFEQGFEGGYPMEYDKPLEQFLEHSLEKVINETLEATKLSDKKGKYKIIGLDCDVCGGKDPQCKLTQFEEPTYHHAVSDQELKIKSFLE